MTAISARVPRIILAIAPLLPPLVLAAVWRRAEPDRPTVIATDDGRAPMADLAPVPAAWRAPR